MRSWTVGKLAILVTLAALAHAQAASYCPPTPCSTNESVITDVCGLEGIANNPSATYTLGQNIDATCTADVGWNGSFSPIGNFKGRLNGNGHWINGLQISGSEPALFQINGGTISDVGLTNAQITLTGTNTFGGSLTAVNLGAIAFAYVTTNVNDTSGNNYLGGIAGFNDGGSIVTSYFGGNVNGGFATGGIAAIGGGDTVLGSYASGTVSGMDEVGGIEGQSGGTIDSSVATGKVTLNSPANNITSVGGLVGNFGYSQITNSYSTSSILETGSQFALVGGLVGGKNKSSIATSLAAGPAVGLAGSKIGGLVGDDFDANGATSSYWDTTTSNINVGTSGGNESGITGDTTAQLHAGLPTLAFASSIWASATPSSSQGNSFPFLIDYSCPWKGTKAALCTLPSYNAQKKFPLLDPTCNDPDNDNFFCMEVPPLQSFFQPSLAQLIAIIPQFGAYSGVYTFLPIGQLQLFQYTSWQNAEEPVADAKGNQYPAAKLACYGTVYTMLARMIGTIYASAPTPPKVIPDKGKPNICGKSEPAITAHIDCLLENSSNLLIKGEGLWPKSMQQYATFSSFTSMNDLAIKSALLNGNPVIVQGSAGKRLAHVMLATAIIEDSNGNLTRLVLNDPELGMQVFVDMNVADTTAYHHAVLNPTGPGHTATYSSLSGFDFIAETYSDVAWLFQSPKAHH